MVFLSFFSLTGYAYALQKRFGHAFGLGFFVALASVIVCLYCAALSGVLPEAATGMLGGGLLLLVWRLVAGLREGRSGLTELLSPEFCLLLVCAVAYWLHFQDNKMVAWDEFSHWGIAAKELYFRNTLALAQGNDNFWRYPPGSLLGQYFFFFTSAAYNEGAVYFGQFMLLAAPLVQLFHGVRLRTLPVFAALFVVVVILVLHLGNGMTSLLVEPLLGAWFAGVLIAYLSGEKSCKRLLALLPCLVVLTLLKEVGLFLSGAACLFMAVHMFAMGRTQRPRLKSALALAALVLALVLAHQSWSRTVSAAEANPPAAKAHTLLGARLQWLFLGGTPPQGTNKDAAEIRNRYFSVLRTQQLSKNKVSYDFNEFNYGMRPLFTDHFRLSALGWAVLLALLNVLHALTQRGKRRQDLLYTAGFLSLLFVLYGYMLLYLYTFLFSSEQGLQLVSYVRYMHIVVLPMALVSVAAFAPALSMESSPVRILKGRVNTQWLLLGLLLLLFVFVERPYWAPLHTVNTDNMFRERIAKDVNRLQGLTSNDTPVWVVFPVHSNGFFRLMLEYELAPAKAEVSDADVLYQSPDVLRQTLLRYDYVYFPVLSQPLWDSFHGFFKEPPAGKVFRIHRDGQMPWLEPAP